MGLKIEPVHERNFEVLRRAIKDNRAAILVVMDKVTGREEIAVVALNQDDAGGTEFVPFAILLAVHENPYDRYLCPNAEGGYDEGIVLQ